VSDIASVPTGAPRRPAVVSAAGYTLLGVAVAAVLLALLPLPSASHVSAVARDAYANVENGDTTATAVSATIYVTVVVYLLAAAGLVVLARFDLRGANGARIATWIVGGVGVLCCGSGILIGRLASGVGTNTSAEMQAANDKVRAAYPSWLFPTQTTVTVLALLGLILVIILLALPASAAYFRPAVAQQPADPGLPPLPYPEIGGEPPAAPPAAPPAPPADPAPSRDQ
jgi:hypothetical protein